MVIVPQPRCHERRVGALELRHRPRVGTCGRGGRGRQAAGSVVDRQEQVAARHGRAGLGVDEADHAVLVGEDRLLHLHGLEHEHEVALDDLVALGDRDLHDRRLHGRLHGVAGGGVDRVAGGAPARCGAGRRGTGRGCPADELVRQRDLDAAARDLDDDRGAGRRPGGLAELARPRLDRVVVLGLDPAGVDRERVVALGRERGVAHDVAVEGQHGRQAGDLELVEGAARALEGVLAARARDDELREQRVEGARDLVAGGHAGVDAHAGSAGEAQHVHRSGRGEEVAAGVLAVDAELDRVAGRDGVGVVERAALGEPELLAHEVDAGDLLGDRVLDLQAGVHLEERHRAVLADEELAGAGADVADLLEDGLRRLVERAVLLLGEERRGRLLDELLVPALQRAVARRHDHDVAVLVGEALGLDVARLVEVLLDEALAPAERGDRLAGGRIEELGHLLAGAGDLEAATAAAERGLDRHGEPVHVDELEHLRGIRHGVQRARRERGAHLLGDVARGDLVAEALDRLGRRADPGEAGVDHGAGEVGVLGEEAVAGVHRVGARSARHREQLVDDEVRVRARGAVERVGLVGELRVTGVAVLVGVDGDRADAGITGGADDAHGDLSTVGDEDLGDTRHNAQAYWAAPARLWVASTKKARDPCGRRQWPSRADAAAPTSARTLTARRPHVRRAAQRRFQSDGQSTPSSRTRSRSVESDRPTTVDGSPSTRRMNGPPRLSIVNAPATSSGSPVAT